MTTQPLLADVAPMPLVLAGGAAIVLATAAALTNRSATRPELPAHRWSRPLPPALAVAADRTAVRVALRGAVLSGAVVLCGAAATADGPVHHAAVVLAALVTVAVLTGPLPRIANPVRLALRHGHARDGMGGEAIGWPAVLELAALSALVLTVRDGRVLAAALAAHLLVQTVLTGRRGGAWPARGDALEAVCAVTGVVAPIGRADDGRLAWRNPVVNAAHAAPGRAAGWLTAVLAGLALTGATAEGVSGAAPALLRFAAVTVAAAVVVRAGVIRPFFVGAVGPIAAAYGLLAGGRWLRPVDLLVFVGLHAVAIAVLHRQAIARHDPRSARALQFLPRSMVVVSVLAGLAVFTPA